MKKACLFFLLVGLTFTALQVATVAAVTGMPGGPGGMPGMGDHQGDNDHCAALHPGGAATHVDPPQAEIDAIETEYRVSCETGNCALSDASYASLESQGHSRDEVNCFLAEGERSHNEQHGGDMHGGPGGMPGMTGGPGGMPGMTGGPGGMPGMGDHQGDNDHCAALHPGGAATHVDPPQAEIDAIETEYRVSCETGNCALSDASYASLESQGHSRDEVNCFLAEGERSHNEQHGGDMHGGPGGMPGMTGGPGGMPGMTGGPGGMPGMGDHQGDNDHCAALHPGGAATHVDPPQAEIDAIETEYRVSCETGNCALSDASYASLESQGHSRDEVNCFLAEGERSHNEQHGGDMHGGPGGMPGMTGGPGGMPGGPGDMHGGPGGMPGMTGGPGSMAPMDIHSSDPCMVVPPGPGRDGCYANRPPTGAPGMPPPPQNFDQNLAHTGMPPMQGGAGMPGMGDHQGGMNPQGMTGGQCDPNPACVENCCPAGDPAPDTAPAGDPAPDTAPAGDPAPDTAPAEDTLLLGPAE